MASSVNYEFVDKVPEDHFCSICTSILKEPVLVECCGQLFCEDCLKKWLQEQKSCPHCRKENFNFIKNLRMKRLINALKIYCPNRTKGCEEVTTVGECDTHLKTCLFVEVDCINDCRVRMLRKELANHIVNDCPKRTLSCQYCNKKGTYKYITGRHKTKCPSFPLDCPNNCGHEQIQRKDLPDHQKVCPLEPVKCPFFKAGCKQVMLRNKLQNHVANDCLKCKVNCQYCNEEGKKEDIVSKTHTDDCPSLPVHCPNNCGHDKIQRKDLPDHQKVCPLEPVKCPFFEAGCTQEMQRIELQDHTDKKCLKRTINCQYCEEEGMYELITAESHIDKCPSFPLDCPNNCGPKIQRKDLPDHQKECPLEPVKCPFFEAGCKQEIPRKELAAHKAANMEHHLELMMIVNMNTLSQLSKLEAVKRTAKATKQELDATKRLLKQVSLKLDGLMACVPKVLPTWGCAADINNIKTAIQAMTTMLEYGKQYYLPLVMSNESTARSPSFYIQPGYKMYISRNEQNLIICIEKGEHDDNLNWPMPKMNIALETWDTKNKTVKYTPVCICIECGKKVKKMTEKHHTETEIVPQLAAKSSTHTLPLKEVLIKIDNHKCQWDKNLARLSI